MLDKLSYLTSIINSLLGITLVGVLVGVLGDSYANYVLLVSMMAFFSFDFGLGIAVGRIYAQELEKTKSSYTVGYYFQIMILAVLPLICAGMFVFIKSLNSLYPSLSRVEISEFENLLVMGMPLMLLTVTLSGVDGFFAANGEMLVNRKITVLFRIFYVFLSILVVMISRDYTLAYLLQIGSLGTMRLVKAIYFFSTRSVGFKRINKDELMAFIPYFGWVTVSMIADRLFLNVIPTILSRYGLKDVIRLYGVSQGLLGNYYSVGKSLSGNYLRDIVNNVINADHKRLKKVLSDYTNSQMVALSVILTVFIVFGRLFLGAWIGNEFVDYLPWMAMLLYCVKLALIFEIIYEVAYAYDKVYVRALIYVLSAVFNFILLTALIPMFGGVGLFIALAATFLFAQVVFLIVVSSGFSLTLAAWTQSVFLIYGRLMLSELLLLLVCFITQNVLVLFAFFAVYLVLNKKMIMVWIREVQE